MGWTGGSWEPKAAPPRPSKKITSRAATPLPLATMLSLFFDFARLQYARGVFTGIHKEVSLVSLSAGSSSDGNCELQEREGPLETPSPPSSDMKKLQGL